MYKYDLKAHPVCIKNPLIVCGTGRSGTTLVSEILFRHRSLAFPSNYIEKFPGYPMINLIRPLYDNSLYKLYGEKKQSTNEVSILNKYFFTPSEAWKMWDYLTLPKYDFSRGFLINQKVDPSDILRIRNYFSKMVNYQFRNRLAFKLTGPPRFDFLNSIFPGAFFIIVKRNPIHVVSSFLNTLFWQKNGLKNLWWKGAYNQSEIEYFEIIKDDPVLCTAFQIKKILDVFEIEKSKFPNRYFELEYEDFIRSPLRFTEEIFNWTYLDFDDKCNQYIKKRKMIPVNAKDTDYFDGARLKLLYSLFYNNG